MAKNRIHNADSDNKLFIVSESSKIETLNQPVSKKKQTNDLEILSECYLLKYPNILLRVFGLYHRKDDPKAFKIYALMFIIIDIINVCRSFTVYSANESLTAEFGLKILFTVWAFMCMSSALIIYINQESQGREPKLLINITNIIEFKITKCRQKTLRIYVYTAFIIGFSMAVFNILGIMVGFFGPSFLFKGFKMFLAPFNDVEIIYTNIAYKIFALFLISISSFHWCLSVSLYASHVLILIEMFNSFNRNFKKFVKESIIVDQKSANLEHSVNTSQEENVYIEYEEKKCVCSQTFEKHRILHLKLTYLVQLLDKCYQEFIAISVLLYIVVILVLLYIMSDWSGNCISGVMTIMYPFWFIVGTFILLIIVVLASILNSKVTNVL